MRTFSYLKLTKIQSFDQKNKFPAVTPESPRQEEPHPAPSPSQPMHSDIQYFRRHRSVRVGDVHSAVPLFRCCGWSSWSTVPCTQWPRVPGSCSCSSFRCWINLLTSKCDNISSLPTAYMFKRFTVRRAALQASILSGHVGGATAECMVWSTMHNVPICYGMAAQKYSNWWFVACMS